MYFDHKVRVVESPDFDTISRQPSHDVWSVMAAAELCHTTSAVLCCAMVGIMAQLQAHSTLSSCCVCWCFPYDICCKHCFHSALVVLAITCMACVLCLSTVNNVMPHCNKPLDHLPHTLCICTTPRSEDSLLQMQVCLG